MNKRLIITTCVTVLLIVATVGVVICSRRQSGPPPEVLVAASPAEVRVKAVERKSEPTERGEAALASGAVAIVCGMDEATADRYEARNDALRSIARRRDLPKGDVEALLAYLRSQDDALRVERVAALKNDVMNLLRNQDPPAEGLVETLIGMLDGNNMGKNNLNSSGATAPDLENAAKFRGENKKVVFTSCSSCFPSQHPPVVIDYCIQHLGAMVNELDDAARVGGRGAPALPNGGVRGVLVKAAGDKTKPYAGTALYSLAEDKRATNAQESELKRLTLALCRPGVNNVARIAAIQLAGQRGYAEALPVLRETLAGTRRDAVLDMVSIGSVGLLGNADDIPILSRFATDSRRAAAVEAAIQRIKERANVNRNSEG